MHIIIVLNYNMRLIYHHCRCCYWTNKLGYI